MANRLDAAPLTQHDAGNDTGQGIQSDGIRVAQFDQLGYAPNYFGEPRMGKAPPIREGMTSEHTNTLIYGDMNFDANLARPGFDTLQINGMPAGVQLKTWADQRGLYFYFDGGMDGRSPHYIPEGLKSIALNGVRKDVDDMAVDTYLGMRNADSNRLDFSNVNGQTNPLAYAFRMTTAPDDMIQRNLAAAEQGVRDLPDNAYAHMRLADLLTWDAMRPIRDAAAAGAPHADLNNGFTMPELVRARNEAGRAADIALQQGEPFAEAQARRRQDMLSQLPSLLQAAGNLDHLPSAPKPQLPYTDPFQPRKRGS